jgi:hypothetical protein
MSEGSISVETMALMARSKLPGLGLVEPDRRLHHAQVALDVEVLLQHGLDRDRPQLEGRDVAHDEVEILEAVGVPASFIRRGFLHGRLEVLL